MFTLLNDEDEVVKVEERDRKVDALAEKIRAMECQNSLGFDVTNMGLVDGLRIPYKFKAPSFDKYNGTSCPRTHVQAYYRKISAYTDDEKMWMYFFQDSLSGASLYWRKFQGVRPEMAGIGCKGATPYAGKGVDRYVHWNFARSVHGPDGELPFR
ncbi:hypothetical protein KIW84_041951 [Lathyrus oleraceus]|uniref:Uncharacterized protein n=1 Tax=Pisum sativum TaxID=3888 RepID=A0A9D4XD16_PEA|nr:hypothetical protein KIW84_041951 [Pisum sativum]